MRVTGTKGLLRQLGQLPAAVERNVIKSVRLNTEQAARLAKVLVPVKSGDLKAGIYTKYDNGGLVGSVEAAAPTKEAQTKANAVEFGRKKGNRGTTSPHPFIRPAQATQAPKFRKSVKSAVRRGLKEATRG